jgi:dTDP-4-dehydrorhamnose reductase
MKILLFGKNGQVGWELQRSLAPLGELTAIDVDSKEYCGDFADLTGIKQTIQTLAPDVIVNAAAYTAVDKAESEKEFAHMLNAQVPELLAREAKQRDAWLIHYSTDYVFDGSGEKPWQETDRTEPLSVYGQTKLAGDLAIREVGCRHLIFRTSWVYGGHGANFAKTMLRLAQERDQLNIVNDQFGAPTGADLLADVTAHCLRQAIRQPEVSGLYHLAASGVTSWYDYACFVIETARHIDDANFKIKVAMDAIKPIPTSAFQSPAPRPRNSRLDTSKLQKTFNLTLPHWQNGVHRMLMELSEK